MSSEQKVPPYPNRGAQNTLQEALVPCVDWFQVTFKNVEVDHLITEILLLESEKFLEMERGGLGYLKCKRYGNIQILYEGKKDMGIHLIMSGTGCREFESEQIMDWTMLLRVCMAYKANITRMDLAIDDYKGYFKIPNLVKKIKKGELQSKFKKAIEINDIDIASGKVGGKTIYYGSQASRIRIRMYDKQAEKGTDYFWNRTELQLRDERAQLAAELIIARDGQVGDIAKGILKHYLRFCKRGNDTNKSRWKTEVFWNKFLGDVEKLKLTVRKPDKTLAQKISWLDRQASKTLAMIMLAENGDLTKMIEMINNGTKKIDNKDKMLIQQYQKENFINVN